jgi:hypothetical protein
MRHFAVEIPVVLMIRPSNFEFLNALRMDAVDCILQDGSPALVVLMKISEKSPMLCAELFLRFAKSKLPLEPLIRESQTIVALKGFATHADALVRAAAVQWICVMLDDRNVRRHLWRTTFWCFSWN